MITIDIIKRSATLSWNSGAEGEQRLHLAIEDPLAASDDLRRSSVKKLKAFASLLRQAGLEVNVITHSKADSLLGEPA